MLHAVRLPEPCLLNSKRQIMGISTLRQLYIMLTRCIRDSKCRVSRQDSSSIHGDIIFTPVSSILFITSHHTSVLQADALSQYRLLASTAIWSPTNRCW